MTVAAPAESLQVFCEQVLKACGADQASAEAASWAMMHASLHGIDSHGIRLLPLYADCLASGLVKGRPAVTVTRKRRAAALVDADGGLGHLATYRAMDEACELARDCGIGMAGVIRSTHFGAAGAYALAAARAGFIGLVTANSGAFVIPHGGSRPLHGTNPIALAAPNPGGEPFLLDMATSAIPWNKVLRSRTESLELAAEVAVDERGGFVTDPHRATALAPVGGKDFSYKGAAMAGFAEVLSAVLTGMRLSFEQDGLALADTGLGHFVMAIDASTFVPPDVFGAGLARYFAAFAAQPGTYAAGGPEWLRRDARLRDGVPLPPGTLAELRAVAAKTKVPAPF